MTRDGRIKFLLEKTVTCVIGCDGPPVEDGAEDTQVKREVSKYEKEGKDEGQLRFGIPF